MLDGISVGSIPILNHKKKLSGIVILTYFQPDFQHAEFPNGLALNRLLILILLTSQSHMPRREQEQEQEYDYD